MAAARKRRARDDDEDDDDAPARIGRPRSPEAYGPEKPEAHEREEYVKRLQSILDALEIVELGRDERAYLQRVIYRCDWLRRFDARRFTENGDEKAILILRSIAESANGAEALKLPILQAVSGCLHHQAWTSRGLAFLDAMDAVPLLEIQQTLRDLGLEDHLETSIRWKLTKILGSPFAPPPKLKKRAKSRLTERMAA